MHSIDQKLHTVAKNLFLMNAVLYNFLFIQESWKKL